MENVIERSYWIETIERLWKEKSILWLSGVRRTGKTFLSKSLENIEYFDCELPSVRRMIESPEDFLSGLKSNRVVLDEIHRLPNPSEVLKIAADHFPKTRVLATGSSTLGASRKFKDTLTGRKAELWLTPMTTQDMDNFGNNDLKHRLLHGGLPSFFQSIQIPERDIQEWIDAYWAKDIQELFRLERKYSMQKFTELLMAQSGGIFEATRFAAPCEVSRTTITNYLSVLENTFVVHVVRPYNTRRAAEIISAPKVFGFDSGFVCFFKGWHDLRKENLGYLWEHFVLNQLHAELQTRDIRYWRNKRGLEVDFIIPRKGKHAEAIECKWSLADFNPAGLLAFRKLHPNGENFVVLPKVERPFIKSYADIQVEFMSLQSLTKRLKKRDTLNYFGKVKWEGNLKEMRS